MDSRRNSLPVIEMKIKDAVLQGYRVFQSKHDLQIYYCIGKCGRFYSCLTKDAYIKHVQGKALAQYSFTFEDRNNFVGQIVVYCKGKLTYSTIDVEF
jgi:hypothetical protein